MAHKGCGIEAIGRVIQRRGVRDNLAATGTSAMVEEQIQGSVRRKVIRKQSMLKNPAMQT